eukprot:TRINITY_DN561_c1_g1_i1.p1 TRINITY_DN561_c1_g1~~TRINITY_DN561_c1_g1_i1.p1  ORF type:complete len:864 (-),score=154.80 TRINITY_DN561_c1_g1_i1:979-3570(-)
MDLRTILNDEQLVAPPPPPLPPPSSPSVLPSALPSALPPPPAPHLLLATPVFAVQPPLPLPLPLPLQPQALHKPLDLVLHTAWPPPPLPATLSSPLYAAPPPFAIPPRAVSPQMNATVARATVDAPRHRACSAKRPRAPLRPSRSSPAMEGARTDHDEDDDHKHDVAAPRPQRRRRRYTRRTHSTYIALDHEQRACTQNSPLHLARVRGGTSKQQRRALRRRAFRSIPPAWHSRSPSLSRASSSASSSSLSSSCAPCAPPASSPASSHAPVDSASHRVPHAAMSSDECSVEEQIIDGVDSFGRCLRPSYSSTDDEDDDDSDVLIIDNNHSGQTTPCQPPPTNHPVHSPATTHRSESPPRHASLHSLSIQDPHEPYPVASKHFDGVPSTAVGDMLQVWDFVTSFSKPLRLTPFKLWHFQQAIVHNSRCELIDACLLRLVQIIVSDKALVNELDIPDTIIRPLTTTAPRNAVDIILTELPNILLFESDDVDDHLLHVTVQKLRHASRKEAFYKSIDPVGKCRVLRELVDYATMTDTLRHCVSTNLELAEEERKKAKEENSALRRKYENQLRELRTELLEYKLKHGMIEPPTGSTGDKKSPALPIDSNRNEQKNCATGTSSEIEIDNVAISNSNSNQSTSNQSHAKSDSASGSTSREGHTTRKEKLLQAQRERKEAIERRAKERGAQAIVARMDKVRASLKSLKNIRLRRRKASDSFPVIEAHGEHQNGNLGPQYSVRTYSLGIDRDDRCYWFFSGSGRIWVEDTRDADWFSLTSMKSVHGLLRWLSPHRIEERLLKKRLRQRLRLIEDEMQKEQKSFEMAETEASKERDLTPRTTRAGKRRANQEAKTKKNKAVTTFLDYQNLEM